MKVLCFYPLSVERKRKRVLTLVILDYITPSERCVISIASEHCSFKMCDVSAKYVTYLCKKKIQKKV